MSVWGFLHPLPSLEVWRAFALLPKENNIWHLFSYYELPGLCWASQVIYNSDHTLWGYRHPWFTNKKTETEGGFKWSPRKSGVPARSAGPGAPFLNESPRPSTTTPQPTGGPLCMVTEGHSLGSPVLCPIYTHLVGAGARLGSKSLCHPPSRFWNATAIILMYEGA